MKNKKNKRKVIVFILPFLGVILSGFVYKWLQNNDNRDIDNEIFKTEINNTLLENSDDVILDNNDNLVTESDKVLDNKEIKEEKEVQKLTIGNEEKVKEIINEEKDIVEIVEKVEDVIEDDVVDDDVADDDVVEDDVADDDVVDDDVADDDVADDDVVDNDFSIYSWNTVPLFDYNIKTTVEVLKELKVGLFYNSFDEEDIISGRAKNIVSVMSDNNIKTYSLMGNPEWYDNTDVAFSRINNLIEYNSKVADDEKIIGIVLDIEPYVLADYENDSVNNFIKYASTIKSIYSYANKNGFELVTTIPNWYDDKYFNESIYSEDEISQAKQAIKDIFINSDKISIMNFYKLDMVDAISYEVSLAKELDKEIESISEFQRPSADGSISDGITLWSEDNPFQYFDSKCQLIDDNYDYDNITFSYHDLITILELKGVYEKNVFNFVDDDLNSIKDIEIIVKFPSGETKLLKYSNVMVLPKNKDYQILLPGCQLLKTKTIDDGDNTLSHTLTINKFNENILEIYPKLYNGTDYVSIDSGKILLVNDDYGIVKTTNITSGMYAVFFGVYSNLKYRVIIQDENGNNYEFEYATAKADDGTFKKISDDEGNLIIPQGFRADSYVVPTFYLK